MWFEECFPRGETRAFAGAVKEAMAYAELRGLNRAEGIAGYLYDLAVRCTQSGRNGAEPSVARPPLLILLVIVHDNMIIPAETHHESRTVNRYNMYTFI